MEVQWSVWWDIVIHSSLMVITVNEQLMTAFFLCQSLHAKMCAWKNIMWVVFNLQSIYFITSFSVSRGLKSLTHKVMLTQTETIYAEFFLLDLFGNKTSKAKILIDFSSCISLASAPEIYLDNLQELFSWQFTWILHYIKLFMSEFRKTSSGFIFVVVRWWKTSFFTNSGNIWSLPLTIRIDDSFLNGSYALCRFFSLLMKASKESMHFTVFLVFLCI